MINYLDKRHNEHLLGMQNLTISVGIIPTGVVTHIRLPRRLQFYLTI